MKNTSIQYYVEGEDEKKLISVLKSNMEVIKPGRVQKLNVVQDQITDANLRTLKSGTIVVLVFDTDTEQVEILKKNIKKLNGCRAVSKVITIPQVPNLEGELVRSCNINDVTELLNSRSRKDFKNEFIRVSNLEKKLIEHDFDLTIFWTKQPEAPYQDIINNAEEIKIYANF